MAEQAEGKAKVITDIAGVIECLKMKYADLDIVGHTIGNFLRDVKGPNQAPNTGREFGQLCIQHGKKHSLDWGELCLLCVGAAQSALATLITIFENGLQDAEECREKEVGH